MQAFKGYERVLELNPNASNAASNMVDYLFDIKEYDKALAMVDAAMETWPDNTWVYNRRIELDIVHTKNAASALAATNSAIDLSEDEYGSLSKFIYLAAIHLTIGDEEKGIAIVDRYASWSGEREEPQPSVWDRITGKSIDRPEPGESEKQFRRGLFYTHIGRADLARPELLLHLETSGPKGLQRFLKLAKEDGTQISQENEGNLEYVVDVYIARRNELLPEWAKRHRDNIAHQLDHVD